MKRPSPELLPCLAAFALGAALFGQDISTPTPRHATLERPLTDVTKVRPDRLDFDAPGDGRIWAVGATFKASFGPDGFVYVPFFGSDAPRNYPVKFALRAVRVGGESVPFAATANATRDARRVTFDRGPVREIYDLDVDQIEQTFVVDSGLAGDVDVELEVVSDLVEDATRPGLQFANELGHVDYGTAFVVDGARKTEIPVAFRDGVIHLHVPAAQRGAGAVVIDPVIQTYALTQTLMDSAIPDVAYDATTDRFGVTWVHVFSQTDHDVVAELRTGTGEAVAGTYRLVDPTTNSHTWPRIANLASVDRFLIGMERYLPQNPVGQQYSVWARTFDAPAPSSLGTLRQISPSSTQNQNSVDVGGDSGTGTRWTMVWVHGSDIVGRQVAADGTPMTNTIPIETTTDFCINPQISLSNGNGLVASPRWCVVYNRQVTTTDWDVHGATIGLDGSLLRSRAPIASGSANDLYTYVSSPLVEGRTSPAFLVSYERQTATPEMVVRLVDSDLNGVHSEVNLTRSFGFSGIYCRVESDGGRFAATCRIGTSIHAGTIAFVNGECVLHEPLVRLGSGDSPHLASKRSGGGVGIDYAVVFNDSSYAPDRTILSLYQGRAPGNDFVRRSTGCGVSLNYGGEPFLGRQVQFAINSAGTDVFGLLLGVPGPTVALCGTCGIGLDLSSTLVALPRQLVLPIPYTPSFVGARLAVQGYGIGSGPCVPGFIRLSDTVEFTIR